MTNQEYLDRFAREDKQDGWRNLNPPILKCEQPTRRERDMVDCSYQIPRRKRNEKNNH